MLFKMILFFKTYFFFEASFKQMTNEIYRLGDLQNYTHSSSAKVIEYRGVNNLFQYLFIDRLNGYIYLWKIMFNNS